jgi:hypothetical protein
MMLVIGLAMVGTLLSFYNQQADLQQLRASQVGGQLFQFNTAVRNYLAQNNSLPNSTKTGSLWLKNSTCGGPLAVGAEYLPCSFPDASFASPTKFGGLSLTTSIVSTGTAPNIRVSASTVSTPFTVTNQGAQQVRSDLAGIAAITASAGAVANSMGNGFVNTTDASYLSNPLTGVITMVASNNSNQDIWLRTDGGNQMHANLQFDSINPINRQIVGASRIQNLAGQALYLGTNSGIAPVSGAAVVVDANSEIIGNLRVRSALTVDGGANVAGNVNASGAVTAGTGVTAGGNISAGGSVSASGNVNASALVAQIFYDSNNSGYYVDPAGLTNINALNANTVTAAGRIRTGEFVQIDGVANAGWGCSPSGLQGRDSTGALLSCVNGVWSKPGARVQVAMYQCPTLYGGSLGGGDWGFYGCTGQITNQSTCLTDEYPRSAWFSCAYIGTMGLN